MGAIIGLIITLIILEGLLSADNALVLAVMTGKLPINQRRKALFYGMWGAIGFRAVVIFGWAFIAHWDYLWTLKAAGALYLTYLSLKGIFEKKEELEEDVVEDENIVQKFFRNLGISQFVGTVIAVEVMDIAFSIDSILAAFGLSQNFFILITGGVLGILMMRSVAGVFQKLIEKVPELEKASFVLILIIAVKMFASIWDKIGQVLGQTWGFYDASDVLFFVALLVVFGITFIVHALNNRGVKKNVTV